MRCRLPAGPASAIGGQPEIACLSFQQGQTLRCSLPGAQWVCPFVLASCSAKVAEPGSPMDSAGRAHLPLHVISLFCTYMLSPALSVLYRWI